jgi:hypothetical protein
MERAESRIPAPIPERLEMMRRFMEQNTGDDFVMISVIDRYIRPLQVDGVKPGESSEEMFGKNMQYMYPALFARGWGCWAVA